jgi:hypothetical protein
MQKECYSISDLMEMYSMPYQSAAKFMRDLRGRITIGMGRDLRLNVRGKIHVLDYQDALSARNGKGA